VNPQPFFTWHIDFGNILSIVCIAGPVVFVISKFIWIFQDYPPHRHREENGPLRASGVDYPRKMKPQ
jgi:hypothetical protein